MDALAEAARKAVVFDNESDESDDDAESGGGGGGGGGSFGGGPVVRFAPNESIGALMIMCGGLVMTIDDDMPVAIEALARALGHSDAMGLACFGEQGMAAPPWARAGESRELVHGNLMFGALVFSNKPPSIALAATARRARHMSRSVDSAASSAVR